MSENDVDRAKLIERIKKLLAMAEHAGTNENEAANAAEKAMALLAAHNLTMDEIRRHAKSSDYGWHGQLETGSYLWMNILMGGCAKMYFCGHLVTVRKVPGTKSSTREVHLFIGEKHNVVVAQLMSTYLVATIKRLAAKGSKGIPRNELGKYKQTFYLAAALRLNRRMRERAEEAMAKGVNVDGCNLPALRPLYVEATERFEEWCTSHGIKLQGKEIDLQRRYIHPEGARDGQQAGQDISLEPQVEKAAEPKQIGEK
jgi:hypothetical protein